MPDSIIIMKYNNMTTLKLKLGGHGLSECFWIFPQDSGDSGAAGESRQCIAIM